MYRILCIIVLAIALAGFASAAPESSAASSSSTAASSNAASTYGSSYKGSYKYSFSKKYSGHGWHNKPRIKVVYKTCKKWKRVRWWYGHRKGKLVKYVCRPHQPVSC